MEKPFIKLIQTPRRKYFYDVNMDEVVNISENLFRFLQRDVSDTNSYECVKKEYEELREKGYLSSKKIRIIEHPDTASLKYKADHLMTHLLLQVTQACNLQCEYCAFAYNGDEKLQRKHTARKMSFEIAKKAIDFYADHSNLNQTAMISFYGGEPIINFDLIKKCIEYSNSRFDGKVINFGITTNATILTNEIMDYFFRNRVIVTVSLDGPQKIHDKNRKNGTGQGTYNIVVNNLKKLIEKYGREAEKYLSINVVIDPRDNLNEIYEWLSQPWLDKINKITTLMDDSQLKIKNNYSYSEYRMVYEYRLALQYMKMLNLLNDYQTNDPAYAEANDMESAYWEYLMENHIELPDTFAPGGPCIPGKRKLFVDVEGKFFPCEKVNELCSDMIIGDVNHGFDYEAMSKIMNIAKLTEEECRNCWAFRYCTICEKNAAGKESLSAELKKTYCNSSQINSYRKLKACLMIQERRALYKLSGERK